MVHYNLSMNAHYLDYGIVTHDRHKAEQQFDKLVSEMILGGEEIILVRKSKTDIIATSPDRRGRYTYKSTGLI